MKLSHKAAAGIVVAYSLGLASAAFAQSGPAAPSHEPHGKAGMQHGTMQQGTMQQGAMQQGAMQHGRMAGMQHDKMAGMQKDRKEKEIKQPQPGSAEHAH